MPVSGRLRCGRLSGHPGAVQSGSLRTELTPVAPLHLLMLALSLGGGALLFSMYGQGGGVLYAPVQLLLGVDFELAAARSQFFIVLTALSATLVFRSAKRVDWGLAFALEAAAASGSYFGSLWAGTLPKVWLEVLLACIVLVAAVIMLFEPPPWKVDDEDERFWLWRRRVSGRSYTVNMLIGMPAAAAIGVLGGLTGTAGGFLKIPLLIVVFGMPMDLACGTTAVMVSMTAAAGFMGRISSLAGDWTNALVLGGIVLAAAQIGPRIALRTTPENLQRRFAWVLAVIGAATLARALW
jgi:uncharacterized membrane protein YfcA